MKSIRREGLHIALVVETRIPVKAGDDHCCLPAISNLQSDAAKGLIFRAGVEAENARFLAWASTAEQ
jgi:hypothetical protein